MTALEKKLWWINEEIKNVKHHAKDKRNTELMIAYYDGYETALKEMKKEIIKIRKEG